MTDAKTTAAENGLLKHPLPQRIVHWFNAGAFLFLWLTGIALISSPDYRLAPKIYTDAVIGLFGGPVNLLNAHIYVGIVWFTVIGLSFLVDPYGLALRFLRNLRLTKNDFRWFAVRGRAELDPSVKVPPQGAYNAGQKAFGWTVLLGVPTVAMTGILMFVGTGGGALSQWMVLLHLLAVGVIIAFFFVHFTMAGLIVEERPALRSMFKGSVTEDYAIHHHEEWYDEVKPKGGEYIDQSERFGLLRATGRLLGGAWQALVNRPQRPLWSPYSAGFGIGLAVLLAFVLLGHGLGASGLFSRLGANGPALFAQDYVLANAYWGPTLESGFWDYWLLWLGLGSMAGAFLSAAAGGRLQSGLDRGELISPRTRIFLAFAGGAIVGFATRFTRGCTSHQAISGGSLLATSAWVFVLAVFIGGFLTAFFFRKVWR